jgi:hypothetical protein
MVDGQFLSESVVETTAPRAGTAHFENYCARQDPVRILLRTSWIKDPSVYNKQTETFVVKR